jgi:CxxC motif-containing protein (DUF1111 family)
LTAGVSGGEAYLHDGRARSLEEAILWHGGEAEASKEAFRTMSAADRAALIKFLEVVVKPEPSTTKLIMLLCSIVKFS